MKTTPSILIATSLILLLTTTSFATTYTIYSHPTKTAHRIGTLTHSNKDIFLQFYQEGPWIEIGSKLNGHVGWVNTHHPKRSLKPKSKLVAHVLLHDQLNQIAQQRKHYIEMQVQLAKKLDQLNLSLSQEEKRITEKMQHFTQDSDYALKTVTVSYVKKTRVATTKWQDHQGKTHTKVVQLPSNDGFNDPQHDIEFAKPPRIQW